MEYLNRIELRGIVNLVSQNKVGDFIATRFTLYTESEAKDGRGVSFVEPTIFNCTAWSNTCPDAYLMKSGDVVEVVGRLRSFRYTMADGSERAGMEVLVHKTKIINQ